MNTTRATHPMSSTHNSAWGAGACRGAASDEGGVGLAIRFAEALAIACSSLSTNTGL
jgi:hypothetical protein